MPAVGHSVDARPGEFRPARIDGKARLVLVHSLTPGDGAIVSLITNETEFATSADVLVKAEESGFACDVLIETDIIGSVFTRQLGDVVGQLPESFNSLLSLSPDLSKLHDRVGFPLNVPWDARRDWKLTELSDLSDLGAERLAS